MKTETEIGKKFEKAGNDLREALDKRPTGQEDRYPESLFRKIENYFAMLESQTAPSDASPAVQADLCLDLQKWVERLGKQDRLTTLVTDLALSSTRGFAVRIMNEDLYETWANARRNDDQDVAKHLTEKTADILIRLEFEDLSDAVTFDLKQGLMHLTCRSLFEPNLYDLEASIRGLSPDSTLTAKDLLHFCLWRQRRRINLQQKPSPLSTREELRELMRLEPALASDGFADSTETGVPLPLQATFLHWTHRRNGDPLIKRFAENLFRSWRWIEDPLPTKLPAGNEQSTVVKLSKGEFNPESPVKLLAVGGSFVGKTTFFNSIYQSLQPGAGQLEICDPQGSSVQFGLNTLNYFKRMRSKLSKGKASQTSGNETLDAKQIYNRGTRPNVARITVPWRATDYRGGDVAIQGEEVGETLEALFEETQAFWFMLDDRHISTASRSMEESGKDGQNDPPSRANIDPEGKPGQDDQNDPPPGADIDPVTAIGAWYQTLLDTFSPIDENRETRVPIALVLNKADLLLGKSGYLATTPAELQLLPADLELGTLSGESVGRDYKEPVDHLLDFLRRSPLVNRDRTVQKKLWKLFSELRDFFKAIIENASHFQVFLSSADLEVAKHPGDPRMPLRIADWTTKILRPVYERKLVGHLVDTITEVYEQLSKVTDSLDAAAMSVAGAQYCLAEMKKNTKQKAEIEKKPGFYQWAHKRFGTNREGMIKANAEGFGTEIKKAAQELYRAYYLIEADEATESRDELGKSLEVLTKPLDEGPRVVGKKGDEESDDLRKKQKTGGDLFLGPASKKKLEDDGLSDEEKINFANNWRKDLIKKLKRQIQRMQKLSEKLSGLQEGAAQAAASAKIEKAKKSKDAAVRFPSPEGLKSLCGRLKNLGLDVTEKGNYLGLESE
jgi:hypothetical protein